MKKALAPVLCAAMLTTSAGIVSADNTTVSPRQVEYLGRGGYGIAVDDGVYLSWRLHGSILNSTDHGHGDALHASDFDNDGEQEIFSVHEEPAGYKQYGAEVRKAKNAEKIAGIGASGDQLRLSALYIKRRLCV